MLTIESIYFKLLVQKKALVPMPHIVVSPSGFHQRGNITGVAYHVSIASLNKLIHLTHQICFFQEAM